MDSLQDDVRRSPRIVELQDRQKQLWHAQYKSKQEILTEQAFNERRHLAYQIRKTRMDEAGTSSSVQLSNSAGAHKAESVLIRRRSPRFMGCGNTAETSDQASVQVSNSAGGFIPRRSPRFIAHGNTAESLNQVRRRNMSEEQLAGERDRKRVRQRTRRLIMTEEQRLIERERDRNRKKAAKEKLNLPSTSIVNDDAHISKNSWLVNDKETVFGREPIDKMMEEQRLIESECDHNRYLAAKEKLNFPSSSAGNTSSNLVEHVMHEHAQAEVERLIGRISTIGMNTSEGYMELVPEHKGDDLDESHQQDMQAGTFLTNFKTKTCLQGGMIVTWLRNMVLLDIVCRVSFRILSSNTYCTVIAHM
ncbi:uncharacterized protein LOC113299105 isoform X2 [Papaver somniferum]|uniref:uncharacterized protein LOC113299105 isoform X2 n=1 Tax=Papaver somniferum TaxID=3469 RepID=UPI000E6F5003|nr:uncharacterized protein LOC113299105 isoform X2 [Papaver somniferum]